MLIQNSGQLAYFRIWKWALVGEWMVAATLGFSTALWCGLSVLLVWAGTNRLFYRQVISFAKAEKLAALSVAFAIVNSLAFILPVIIAVFWHFYHAGVHRIGREVWEVWPQAFVMILLFALGSKILIHILATVVRRILHRRLSY